MSPVASQQALPFSEALENVRVGARAYLELEMLSVTPSERMRQALQHVAPIGQLAFRSVLMTDDDALYANARERLSAPQRVEGSLDDL